MSLPSPSENDAVFGFLVRRFPPGEPAAEAESCPDENQLGGWVEGTLLPEEREPIERHLAACGRCRVALESLPRSGRAEAEPAVPPARFSRIPHAGRRWALRPRLAVAAAALLAVTAAIAFAPDLLRVLRGEAVLQTDSSLVASARDLARRRPDVFAGFSPLSREERLAPVSEMRGGILVALHPVGKIRETRPTFRWETSPEVSVRRLALRTPEGGLLWRRPAGSPPFEFPPDEPELEAGGHYAWEVTAEGPSGEAQSRRAFEVADAQEVSTFDSALKEIETAAPARLRALLAAHFALRRGFLGEAERAARAYLAAEPADPVGQETLFRVLRLLGASEADRVGIVEPASDEAR